MLLRRLEYEVYSLVRQIDDGRLDLQPPFQRGQVWSESKKKRLVDSILRNWYVPPIHVVVNHSLDRDEILDGQQRLRAIYDFYRGKFTVDGLLEPLNDEISELNGLWFRDLPQRMQSRFLRFIITTVRLEEYEPSEPGELFFRLNQPMSLTSAEQRNALIGPARDQIKKLSELLEERAEGQSIGFTNSRMNFDDILSRVALTVELGSLYEKITAARLASKYRKGQPFSEPTYRRLKKGVIRFACAIQDSDATIKFNKATLYSWIVFLVDNDWLSSPDQIGSLPEFLTGFEAARSRYDNLFKLSGPAKRIVSRLQNEDHRLVEVFNDRASSRVNDVASVVLRDFCLNAALYLCGPSELREAMPSWKQKTVADLNSRHQYLEDHRFPVILERDLFTAGWGDTL